MAKVILDAAHGGNNIGYICDKRMEKTDNLMLALEIGKILEEHGIDTIYTRKSDVYISPLSRLKIADRENSDLLLSIHRMEGCTPNGAPGMDFFINENENAKILAQNISNQMEKIGFRSYGIKDNLSDLLLDNVKTPAVSINIGYTDRESDNEFYDNNIKRIAQAIALGILETLNLQDLNETKKLHENIYKFSYENANENTYDYTYKNSIGLFGEVDPKALPVNPGKVKVILDAGHGGNDYGNMNHNRAEKDDNLRLVLAVGNVLIKNGVTVVYTRTADKTVLSMERINMINREGGDLFISFHRMTGGMANCHSGVETFINNENPIGEAVALNISDNLCKVGFHNHGIYCETEISILKNTIMPAIMIMIGYIDSEIDNMNFDARFSEITQAIANGILLTFGNAGGEFGMEKNQNENKCAHYRVQVGLFSKFTDAEIINNHMMKQGFSSQITRQGSLYVVHAGDYLKLDEAVEFERTLRMQNFHTLIVAV